MKVMKFGGTSVGSARLMKNVATLITNSEKPVFVVLSAMSGTTNSLINCRKYSVSCVHLPRATSRVLKDTAWLRKAR